MGGSSSCRPCSASSRPLPGRLCRPKFAVEGYADTLRIELAGSGIAVVLIQPGPITSRFRETASPCGIDIAGSVHRAVWPRPRGKRRRQVERFRLGPDAVLRVLVPAPRRRPKARYRVTTPTKVAAILKRLLPTRAMDRIVGGVRR
jgi:NAD(P)-dependent dehydrogenase (short-subunit alcohol dehydrogenase family)